MPEVLRVLKETLNVTFLHEVVPAHVGYGFLKTNGTWGGLIGMLQEEEADISASPLAPSLERLNFIDFSFPITLHVLRFFLHVLPKWTT